MQGTHFMTDCGFFSNIYRMGEMAAEWENSIIIPIHL
jgi:hypothetical protein